MTEFLTINRAGHTIFLKRRLKVVKKEIIFKFFQKDYKSFIYMDNLILLNIFTCS